MSNQDIRSAITTISSTSYCLRVRSSVSQLCEQALSWFI